MAFTKHSTLVNGAGSATLATAVTNINTAVTTGLANAQAAAGVSVASIAVTPTQLIFDGTLYVGFATITYNTN